VSLRVGATLGARGVEAPEGLDPWEGVRGGVAMVEPPQSGWGGKHFGEDELKRMLKIDDDKNYEIMGTGLNLVFIGERRRKKFRDGLNYFPRSNVQKEHFCGDEIDFGQCFRGGITSGA